MNCRNRLAIRAIEAPQQRPTATMAVCSNRPRGLRRLQATPSLEPVIRAADSRPGRRERIGPHVDRTQSPASCSAANIFAFADGSNTRTGSESIGPSADACNNPADTPSAAAPEASASAPELEVVIAPTALVVTALEASAVAGTAHIYPVGGDLSDMDDRFLQRPRRRLRPIQKSPRSSS
jgi:hypothetical protein